LVPLPFDHSWVPSPVLASPLPPPSGVAGSPSKLRKWPSLQRFSFRLRLTSVFMTDFFRFDIFWSPMSGKFCIPGIYHSFSPLFSPRIPTSLFIIAFPCSLLTPPFYVGLAFAGPLFFHSFCIFGDFSCTVRGGAEVRSLSLPFHFPLISLDPSTAERRFNPRMILAGERLPFQSPGLGLHLFFYTQIPFLFFCATISPLWGLYLDTTLVVER